MSLMLKGEKIDRNRFTGEKLKTAALCCVIFRVPI